MLSYINLFFTNELNYFVNLLNRCLSKEDNNFSKYLFVLSSLLVFIFVFLIIYGLKLRTYSPIFEDDFHMLSLSYSDIPKIMNSARPVGYVLVALSNFMPDELIYITFFLTIE